MATDIMKDIICRHLYLLNPILLSIATREGTVVATTGVFEESTPGGTGTESLQQREIEAVDLCTQCL